MNEVQKTFLKFNFVYPKPKEHPFGCFLLLQQTEEKMINWFDMPDEGLSNGGLFEIKELEVTENGTYETKGEMYNKVVVNVEGGGGSSDFSTAEVTLSTAGDGSLPIASIVDNEIRTNVPFFIESFEAILYKGSQVFSTFEIEGTITVGGDAVYDSNEQTITITGDCTITIS